MMHAVSATAKAVAPRLRPPHRALPETSDLLPPLRLPTKILTIAELAELRDRLDKGGQRLVFTNGCFDLLHVGHVRYLQAARSLGDALVVGLNGDASVRALKGPTRPINPEADRAEVLAALECVDAVAIFPDVRATEILRQVRPHVYAKGGDYSPDSLDQDEVGVLKAIGAEIQILPLVAGKSTTSLLAKAQG
jgi:rfaE bifunctional protein nucleotidyltransferase chain/domain